MSKVKDVGAPDATIVQYLRAQNRPYSATDVFNNLHGQIGQTAVVRSLESAAAAGRVTEKVYGKQKVYCALQEDLPSLADDELRRLDEEISALTRRLAAEESELKKLESELSSVLSAPSTDEARRQLASLTHELSEKRARLARLEPLPVVAPEDKSRVIDRNRRMLGEWRKRKRMATDIVDAILEGYPKSKAQLFEDIGLETDEDSNVRLPP